MKIAPLSTHPEPADHPAREVVARASAPAGVLRSNGEFRLVAVRAIFGSQRIFRMEGDITSEPSRYSVQVGEHQHVDLQDARGVEELLDVYFWRFMNHSCVPNSFIVGREVFALRDIQPWEAVTFDYNSTEWDMAEPFRCRCGVPDCLGEVRGYRHLSSDQRSRVRRPAPHLLLLAAREEAWAAASRA